MTESSIGHSVQNNEAWARRIIRRFDKNYLPRWEVYDRLISELSGDSLHCLNLGSGVSESFDQPEKFKLVVDCDYLIFRGKPVLPFVQSDVYALPFAENSFDVVLLRFVVEHLADPVMAMSEIYRVLKKNGCVLILTTNLTSPFIFLPRLIPYRLRKVLLRKLFNAEDQDVFPTFHRFNTKQAVRRLSCYYTIEYWQYIQDTNWTRKPVFLFLFIWHLKTRWLFLPFLRSNFLVLLRRL